MLKKIDVGAVRERPAGGSRPAPTIFNFTSSKFAHRHRQGFSLRDPLARAIGVKKDHFPSIIDATAGLGRDAFLLASLGCSITLLERVPQVAANLQQALLEAQQEPHLAPIIARMQLIQTDSIAYLQHLPTEQKPDVIYLDPMYPPSRKTALVKQEMQSLRELVGFDNDTTELFQAAMQQAKKRVVVKRHRHSPTITELKPSHVIETKVIRFDVYIV